MKLCWMELTFALFLAGIGMDCRSQTVLPNPTGVFVAGGNVQASAVQDDGKIVIGGQFIAVNGIPRRNIARLNQDGSVDLTWNPGPPVDSGNYNLCVCALATHENVVYAAGTFTFMGGQPRLNIAAIDGTTGLATPWDPGTSSQGYPYALAISQDGAVVYVGGDFNNMGGAPRQGIAALAATDGGAISSWNPGIQNYGRVQALAVLGNQLLVGGNFTSIGGQSRNSLASVDGVTGIVNAWAPNPGEVDVILVSPTATYVGGGFGIVAFDSATLALTGWHPQVSSTVYAIAASNDTVYVGGGPNYGTNKVLLAAIDAASGAILNWSPAPDGTSVIALELSGTSLFVGGTFAHIGGNLTGGLGIVDTSTATSANRQLSSSAGTISALQTQPDGKVIVGGSFTAIGATPINNLGRLNVDGSIDLSWDPEPDAEVTALLVSGSIVYVGGEFENIGSHFRQRLAALDLGTGIATSWQPDPNNTVSAIATQGNVVYVGGEFQYIGNAQRSYLAALDASTGLATDWTPAIDGQVLSLATSETSVYVGGYFFHVAGVSQVYLAAIDPASALPQSFNLTPDGPVFALLLESDKLYAAGNFYYVSQVQHPSVVAIDLDTKAVIWDGGSYSTFSSLALAGNELIVGGNFDYVGGQPRTNLASLNISSGLATDWNPSVVSHFSISSPVAAVAVSGDRVIAGGQFDSVNSVARSSIAIIGSPEYIFANGFQ